MSEIAPNLTPSLAPTPIPQPIGRPISVLLKPTTIGRYDLKNSIVMAPMSRYRANPSGEVDASTAEYYRQRATAGLIIAESTRINDWSGGVNAPGIWSERQIEAWRGVTTAVHEAGGRIFLQLWHAGRVNHVSLMPDGRDVAGPSAVAMEGMVMVADGLKPPSTNRALTLLEIEELRGDFAHASKSALAAGFDGVEIHAAGGFLIDQFLQDNANKRTDHYGGSVENRFRFLGEVVDDAVAIWGDGRVGVKLSPTTDYNDMTDSDPLTTFSHVVSSLAERNLAFIEVCEEMPGQPATAEQRDILNAVRELWPNTYIANCNLNPETGAERLQTETASAVSFGRLFIANPDLPYRISQNGPYNTLDPQTFYGGTDRGYTDYPSLEKEETRS